FCRANNNTFFINQFSPGQKQRVSESSLGRISLGNTLRKTNNALCQERNLVFVHAGSPVEKNECCETSIPPQASPARSNRRSTNCLSRFRKSSFSAGFRHPSPSLWTGLTRGIFYDAGLRLLEDEEDELERCLSCGRNLAQGTSASENGNGEEAAMSEGEVASNSSVSDPATPDMIRLITSW
ncbi:unnamed protein product, partial [Clonostachys byssicola]